MRYLLFITLFIFAVAGSVWGQPKPNAAKRKSAPKANIQNFDEADALFGKRKRTAPRKAHDKYANQEVSYRQRQATGQPAAVFEPNDEPLWAKQTSSRKPMRKRTKNQNIEVENDETHRTRPRAARTESVNNNETLRTKGRSRGRKN